MALLKYKQGLFNNISEEVLFLNEIENNLKKSYENN